MKTLKHLFTGMLFLSIALLAFLPTPQEILIEETPIVLYQASVLDIVWNFVKDLDWGTIINLLFAGGLVAVIASIKKVKKEIQDVITEYKLAIQDGKIDENESAKLIKELTEAITETTKLWYMIVGIFKRSKKPINKE